MENFALVGPIGIRRYHLENVCEANEGHQHNYDHTTIVIRGRLKVLYRYERDGQLVDGESIEFGQGETIFIKASVYHTIKALEPNTVYMCVFSHRDFDGIVTERYVGNQLAYV